MALSLPANATPDAVPSEAYVLRDGGWVDAPCQVGVAFPPTRRAAAERGQLAFLLQSADARPLVDELCQSVANALEQTYYGESGSITRALREALLAANQTLFEHNVRADTAARLLLGIGCVVVRGSDLYMARLGPACVWTFSEGALAQFPTDSLWYALGSEAAGDVDNEPPAGMRLDVEPELGHSDAPAQSLVVLLSQSLKHRAQPATLLRALNGDDPAETRRHLQSITQGQDLAMLALAPVGDDADAEPMQGQGEPQGATALQAPSPTPVAAPVAPASASAAAAESATAIGPATLAEERALEQEVAVSWPVG